MSQCHILTTHPLEALPPDAAHHAKWCLQSQATKELAHHRIQIHPLFEVTQAEAWLQAVSHTGAYPHLVIDAFLGMGNNRPLSGCMAQVATWLYDSQQSPFTQPKIVSIDVPSGLSPAMDTLPENPKHFIHPDITLSIGGQALVHVGSHTRHVCGEVMPISLGITPPIEQFPPIAYRITEEAILEAQKRQTPEPTSHKYQRGKICVIGGSLEYPNAPWLSAKASVLAGAGMVWMAHGHSHYHPDAQENTLKAIPYQMPSPENACGSILALGETLPLPTITTQPKADMQTRGSTTENARTHFDSHAFQAIHEACIARRPEVCVIGPGLGRHPHTLEAFLPWLVKLLESLPDLYAILDADALYALGYGLYHTSPALPLLNQHSLWQRCILTPHMGEARQLEHGFTLVAHLIQKP
jgi:NAD(P)H-hydrate repair Nnr-like enzyme with NAD(P)H-hydrate dehydratase domain